ncbi:MAG: cytidylate kinase-like family protein [Desulfobacterales bacterium]|nr:cytidylate kinase-like family protein [Desulfobacterales bacterium]
MSVIMISRGAHHKGEEVAEKTAQKLGYTCVSRDILLEASQQYNVPEIKLKKSMERAPGFLERIGFEKQKYISYVQSALLKRLKEDNVVYHGLAGHFFIQNISHVLTVRIIVDVKDRVSYCMRSEGVSAAKALDMLKKLDGERKKWGQYLYGIDITDPGFYDLVIHIQKLSVDEAADLICKGIEFERFKTIPESQQAMEDLSIAAEVKAVLMGDVPPKEVSAKNGIVTVTIESPVLKESGLFARVEKSAREVGGVKGVRVETVPYIQSVHIVE